VVCDVCGFDADSAEATDVRALEARRATFRAQGLTQQVQISRWDRARPWAALLLGFFIFVVWMKACSSAGWPLFH
jgi:hypothetical protein